jgi:hypothetical protein
MAGRECADILFCLDASGSMGDCIKAVKENINKLVETFQGDVQRTWDVRLGLLAHAGGGDSHKLQSIGASGKDLLDAIYRGGSGSQETSKCFTKDLSVFKKALSRVEATWDEATLVALDIALDFPWRDASGCHRAVVVLTDEAIETGVDPEAQERRIPELIKKIQDKRIKLFILAPASACFYALGKVDRCEYETVEDDDAGLKNTNFQSLMESIGKSVSISQYSGGAADATNPLYGQNNWTGRTSSDDVSGSF